MQGTQYAPRESILCMEHFVALQCSLLQYINVIANLFIMGNYFNELCLFVCFKSHVNSYGHSGTVSSLNHTFSWAGFSKRLTSNLCTSESKSRI